MGELSVQEICEERDGTLKPDQRSKLASAVMAGSVAVIRSGFGASSELCQSDRRAYNAANKGAKPHRRHIGHIAAAVGSDTVRCTTENERATFRSHNGEHFDGLDSNYLQIHTTLKGIGVYASKLLLRQYAGSDNLHAALVDEATAYACRNQAVLPDRDVVIPIFDADAVQQKPLLGVASSAVGNALAMSEVIVGQCETVIFPNGYDAARDPQTLTTHEFWTVHPEGQPINAFRTVAVSQLDIV